MFFFFIKKGVRKVTFPFPNVFFLTEAQKLKKPKVNLCLVDVMVG